MIEQGIYFALGCIITALAALLFAPIYWSRALKLTRRRLQLQIPLSMQEIYAERDQLRAQFAVERLRLEREVARVKNGKADDLAEIGRRTVEVARKDEELQRVSGQLRTMRDEFGQLEAHLEARASAQKEAALCLQGARTALDSVRTAAGLDDKGELSAQTGVSRQLNPALDAVEKQLAAARTQLERAPAELPTSAVRAAEIERLKRNLQQLDLSQASSKSASGETLSAEALAMRESIHALGLAVAAMSRPASETAPPRKEVSEQA